MSRLRLQKEKTSATVKAAAGVFFLLFCRHKDKIQADHIQIIVNSQSKSHSR